MVRPREGSLTLALLGILSRLVEPIVNNLASKRMGDIFRPVLVLVLLARWERQPSDGLAFHYKPAARAPVDGFLQVN